MTDRAADINRRWRTEIAALTDSIPRKPDHDLAPGVSTAALLDLFEAQVTSRHLDLSARRLGATRRGYYSIGSSGHEGNAALSFALRTTDPALLHYRSGAFFAHRARRVPGLDPIRDVLLGVVAAASDPISGGRHKVFGSGPAHVIPQTSTVASHLPRAVGLAFSLERAARQSISHTWPADSVVLCSFGDASANHSTATGAINAAVHTAYQGVAVPVLFVCEDNGIGISVPTPAGWIESAYGSRPGLRYFEADGCDALDAMTTAATAADWVRVHRRPAFLRLRTVRLFGHAGSDVESAYRTPAQIAADLTRDPVLATARLLITSGVRTVEEVTERYDEIARAVNETTLTVLEEPTLGTAEAVRAPIAPAHPDRVRADVLRTGPISPAPAESDANESDTGETASGATRSVASSTNGVAAAPTDTTESADTADAPTATDEVALGAVAQPSASATSDPTSPNAETNSRATVSDPPDAETAANGSRAATPGDGASAGNAAPADAARPEPMTMAQALNHTLGELLARDRDILVFGEDVGRKGGVYGVTKGLRKRFGSRRVFDTLLDEQSILGTALGAGLVGFVPIPEIQYLAYVHNAIDQIRGEAATLAYFSTGRYRNPMVVRVAGLAYQKGFGGHFHNDNSVAALRDIPGVIVAVPSRADDAAAMLRTCVSAARVDGRVCVFLEPIALYHTRDLHPGDGAWSATPDPAAHIGVGSARVHGNGEDLTVVGFANSVPMSLRVADRLERDGVGARVLDLRWLAPLPVDDLLRHARATGRVLIADETRHGGAVSDSVVAALVDAGFDGAIARVTSADSFVPLGPAAETVLLSEAAIEAAARTLLETAPRPRAVEATSESAPPRSRRFGFGRRRRGNTVEDDS